MSRFVVPPVAVTKPYRPRVRTSARPRRLRWWLGGAVLGIALVVGIVVYAAATTTSVAVRNDGAESLRLSGCSIDDALDLLPGRTGNIDVAQGSREGCSVYDHDGYRYIGCLIVKDPSGPVSVPRSVSVSTSETVCERIG